MVRSAMESVSSYIPVAVTIGITGMAMKQLSKFGKKPKRKKKK